jgi:hypothetical protein
VHHLRCRGANLFQDRVELDLDERAFWNQSANVVRRVRRLDSGERFRVRTSRLLPVAIVGKQQTRSNDIFMTGTEVRRRLEGFADRRLGLQKGVARVQHSALCKRRGAADHDVWPMPHGTGVGSDLAEAGGISDTLPPHMLIMA